MSEIALRAAIILPNARICRKGKIKVKKDSQDKVVKIFLVCLTVVSAASFFLLDVDWIKVLSRFGDLGLIFGRLARFSFSGFDRTLQALSETVSVTVLATVYSIVIGMIFGAFAARNLVKNRAITLLLTSFFTFLRAVPTPVWVLLALVSLGLGPVAGIVGLSVHAVAFFAKAFAQCFEDVPAETIEALAAGGATRTQIFFGAVLPAAASQIVAWIGLRFEINFQESAILGMVGAGGIGLAITNFMQGYQYGQAGLAIFMVFVYAYAVEMIFTVIKKKWLA